MSICDSYVSCTREVIDDVTRTKSRLNLEINISPSIFHLYRRSKAQNIGNANGYLAGIFNFRYNVMLKSLSRSKNGDHCENFEILKTASLLTSDLKRPSKNYAKSVFRGDDVIDDVTGWPQSRPSIFLYK